MNKVAAKVKLGDISTVLSGNSAPQEKSKFIDGTFNFYRTSDVGRIHLGEIEGSTDKLNQDGIKGMRLFEVGTVLIPKSGASTFLNHRTILIKPGYVSSHLAGVKANPKYLLDKYLYYFLTTIDSKDLVQDSSYPSLKTTAIENIEIALPSIDDQNSCVNFLDNTLSGIHESLLLTEKSLRKAKLILDSACQNFFNNSQNNFQKITLEKLLEMGWITSHLDGNHGNNYPRKEEFISSGTPYIAANCIVDDEVDFKRSKFLSKERGDSFKKGVAINNDVLFAHNATVGPVAILKTNEKSVVLGTSLTYYRCNPDFIIPEYLAHYMRSNEFVSQYSKVMGQSTRNQVPITKQREFTHLIPSVDMQKKIIVTLDTLFYECKNLESLYRLKIAKMKSLKTALLNEIYAA